MTKPIEPVILYVRQMEEIKKRIDVINFFLSLRGNALYLQSTVESICLQFRKILELIAFASLIANKAAYSAVHKDFSSHHKSDILLKELRRINPHFYPVPVTPKPKLVDGIFMPDLIKTGYLTPGEFVDVFKKCGRLLHVGNPYAGMISIAYYQKTFPVWLEKIVRLLNTHEVHFVDDSTMWIINMKEEHDEKVHFHVFELFDSR